MSYLLHNKKRHSNTHWSCSQVKKLNLKRLNTIWFQLYDILGQHNYRDSKMIAGYQGLGEREDKQAEQRVLEQYNYLGYMHCSFIKTNRIYNKSEPKYKAWTLATMICQYQSTDYSKSTTLMKGVYGGWGWGQELSTRFCSEPKLL